MRKGEPAIKRDLTIRIDEEDFEESEDRKKEAIDTDSKKSSKSVELKSEVIVGTDGTSEVIKSAEKFKFESEKNSDPQEGTEMEEVKDVKGQ